MLLRNFTGALDRGEAFVVAKASTVATAELSVHIKFTRARGQDVAGYYRWDDRRMVLAVKRRLRYPRTAAYGIATVPAPRARGRRPFRLVWHEERFDGPDELLVFVAGHEFWHFLCHSGQRRHDHETKANCNGFAWLSEFRQWPGPGAPVAAVAARPWPPGLTAPLPAPAASPATQADRAPKPTTLASAMFRETVAPPEAPVQLELFARSDAARSL